MQFLYISYNEFHISKKVRDLCNFDKSLYSSVGNFVFKNIKNVREFQVLLNNLFELRNQNNKKVSAGSLNAMGLIDEIFHYVCLSYRRDKVLTFFDDLLLELNSKFSKEQVDSLLLDFISEFPPLEVYNNQTTAKDFLQREALDTGTNQNRSNRVQVLEELILLCLANENPAFNQFEILFSDKVLQKNALYKKTWRFVKDFSKKHPGFGPFDHDLISLLKEPVLFSPNSLKGQLEYIQKYWDVFIGDFLKQILSGIDVISEEEKSSWKGFADGNLPDMSPYSFENLVNEYERFSSDAQWMPNVILMAKTVLVWLDQLSKQYGYAITRLDQIPDPELDRLRDQGFTGLWLIGLWERSKASKRIKQICGNPEAAASAYSLYDYNIAQNIGGWQSLENLRTRLWQRGIRLASDMVPNHTGMDGDWVMNRPDLFIQRRDCPFPHYSFNGENLSQDSRTSIYLEDHYYAKNDCAVVFKRIDNYTGDVRYIYHGNDGTGLPWNDTAQLDFLNPNTRKAVIEEILHVARNFPIIRFDAAMVLAKKSIRRLWYPEPGHGGDIATRSETGLSTQQFNDAIPEEFWREVVDTVARECPDTLLLAEAFWMMEGYFVRTLGMHRVYNSAFMNMLKKEENQKYRETVKNTITFDPQVLKRYVNFMNNPDEETAIAQFGDGDKYFGVCTLMVTMPGLPMFGHGQIEGYTEKYGMEYTKAYKDEKPNSWLVDRHYKEIFPLMKKRYLFSGVENFLFYDLWNNGCVNENVFAYSNGFEKERVLVFYNNKYEQAYGWIKQSNPYAQKNGEEVLMVSRSISEGLNLTCQDDEYTIFQEQKSKLWYIRKSSDICQNGMFVSLNGFEVQVYLNIHTQKDDKDSHLKLLCEHLNGKGCKDIEIEWQELIYKDLYAALKEYIFAVFKGLSYSQILLETKNNCNLKQEKYHSEQENRHSKLDSESQTICHSELDSESTKKDCFTNVRNDKKNDLEKKQTEFFVELKKVIESEQIYSEPQNNRHSELDLESQTICHSELDSESTKKDCFTNVRNGSSLDSFVNIYNYDEIDGKKSNVFEKIKLFIEKNKLSFENSTQKLETKITNKNSSIKKEEFTKLLKKAKNSQEFIKIVLNEYPDIKIEMICLLLLGELVKSKIPMKFSFARKFNEYLTELELIDEDLTQDFVKLFLLANENLYCKSIEKTKSVCHSEFTSESQNNCHSELDSESLKKDCFAVARNDSSLDCFVNVCNNKKINDSILYLLLNSKYSTLLSGMNIFDNIKWFNQEITDESLAKYICLKLIFVNEKSVKKQNEKINEILSLYKKLQKSKENAEFKCELWEKFYADSYC